MTVTIILLIVSIIYIIVEFTSHLFAGENIRNAHYDGAAFVFAIIMIICCIIGINQEHHKCDLKHINNVKTVQVDTVFTIDSKTGDTDTTYNISFLK